MRRAMRITRILLTWCTIFLLTIEPATMSRVFGGCGYGGYVSYGGGYSYGGCGYGGYSSCGYGCGGYSGYGYSGYGCCGYGSSSCYGGGGGGYCGGSYYGGGCCGGSDCGTYSYTSCGSNCCGTSSSCCSDSCGYSGCCDSDCGYTVAGSGCCGAVGAVTYGEQVVDGGCASCGVPAVSYGSSVVSESAVPGTVIESPVEPPAPDMDLGSGTRNDVPDMEESRPTTMPDTDFADPVPAEDTIPLPTEDVAPSPPAELPAAEPDGGMEDDLFGPADAEGAAPMEQPETPPADTGDDLDDLFGAARTPIRIADAPERDWVDNTGRYRTKGQLVLIATDHVRLLKDNGRHCTVPFRRLSADDFGYVQQVARQMGDTGDMQVAQR